MEKNTMEVNGYSQLFGYEHSKISFKISFAFNKNKLLITPQVVPDLYNFLSFSLEQLEGE